MSAFKIDGTFTSESACGAARTSYPIEGDFTAKVIAQDFMVAFASYSAPTISTAHATFTTAYLIGDSELVDLGGGIARFTRTWATVPADRDEFGTYAFQFPGLLGTAPPPYDAYWVATDDGRDPRTEQAKSRIAYHYQLGTPGTITIIPAQVWTLDSNPEARILYLLAAGTYWSDSNPTKEEYLALVAGGTGLGTGANAGEFVAEASNVERYMGDIWVRTTRYVTAV